MRHLEEESAGIQGTHHMAVKNEEGDARKAVKTEERREPAARCRYFWLGEGASSDPRMHGMFPDRTYSDWESVESSDVVSETSETSSDSDILGELYRMSREFLEIKAEVDAEMMEEDRKQGEAGRPRKLPKPIFYKVVWKRHVLREPGNSERG